MGSKSGRRGYGKRSPGVIGRIAGAMYRGTRGNSGMSGQAAESISGRPRQMDAQLERMYRGQSSDSNN